MIINKKLKLWTVITHALIIIGAGHGVAFFLLLEIGWLYGFFEFLFSMNFTSELFFGNATVAALLSLFGEAAMILSLFKKNYKTFFYVGGLVFYWAGIFFFTRVTISDSYTHIAIVTCLPLAICTIICFLGNLVKKFWYWLIDM